MSCVPIINGPVQLYWAPVGSTFPDVDAAPSSPWTLIGQSGSNHYDEDGVEVEMSRSFNSFRGSSLYSVCEFPTEAVTRVRVTMAELSMNTLRHAFNMNAITTDAGPPAIETLSLDLSGDIQNVALLVRGDGKSAIFATGGLQIECNRVAEIGSRNIQLHKGGPAMLQLEWEVLLDTSGGFPGTVGNIVQQSA